MAVTVSIHFVTVTSPGCPICMGITPQQPTFVDEVSAASDLVVAGTATSGRVLAVQFVFKGDAMLKGRQVQVSESLAAGTYLLQRVEVTAPWKSLGAAGPQLAAFIPALLELPTAPPATDSEWNHRLAVFRPYLGHLDPRLAESAWRAWAVAPYRVLRTQSMEAAKLRAWIVHPALAHARPMWIVLLGVAGDAADARWNNQQLDAAWQNNDASLAAALLTARIEREGEGGVTWLESHYIRDRERTLEEIKAAVIALGVQGEAIPGLRPRILAACRTLIAERRPLSGLVARDLIAWQEWSAESHFQTLLTSGEPVLPETRGMINDYLKACRAAARPASMTP